MKSDVTGLTIDEARALLVPAGQGALLGLADLVVLAFPVTGNGTVSWSFGSRPTVRPGTAPDRIGLRVGTGGTAPAHRAWVADRDAPGMRPAIGS
ncbi:hypothetical protein [Streptomyces sp. NPDC005969]|uniref:hypothetical protein n=1 Tax=Streptomyces sp. NPDC005969 TaxID=3156722 RepID=UPI0033C29E7D